MPSAATPTSGKVAELGLPRVAEKAHHPGIGTPIDGHGAHFLDGGRQPVREQRGQAPEFRSVQPACPSDDDQNGARGRQTARLQRHRQGVARPNAHVDRPAVVDTDLVGFHHSPPSVMQ